MAFYPMIQTTAPLSGLLCLTFLLLAAKKQLRSCCY